MKPYLRLSLFAALAFSAASYGAEDEFCDIKNVPAIDFECEIDTPVGPDGAAMPWQTLRTWPLPAEKDAIQFTVCADHLPYGSSVTFAQYKVLSSGGAYGTLTLSVEAVRGQTYLAMDWFAPVPGNFTVNPRDLVDAPDAVYPLAPCGSGQEVLSLWVGNGVVGVSGPNMSDGRGIFTFPVQPGETTPVITPRMVEVYPFVAAGAPGAVVKTSWDRPQFIN